MLDDTFRSNTPSSDGSRWPARSRRAPSKSPRRRDPPAQDPPGVGVNDEDDVGEPRPGRHVGQIGHPQPIGCRRPKPMPSKISRTRCDWIGNCCLAGFAAGRPGQAEFGHQPLDGAAGGAAWRIRTAARPKCARVLPVPPDRRRSPSRSGNCCGDITQGFTSSLVMPAARAYGSQLQFHPLRIRRAARIACCEPPRLVQFVQLDQHERLGSDFASASHAEGRCSIPAGTTSCRAVSRRHPNFCPLAAWPRRGQFSRAADTVGRPFWKTLSAACQIRARCIQQKVRADCRDAGFGRAFQRRLLAWVHSHPIRQFREPPML